MSKADDDVDPNRLAFRPRARILRTLGEELISNETVAVIELVKNAYDADARRVLIRFRAPLTIGAGSIEVIDNGSGMSLNIVRSAWMEPATCHKKQRNTTTKLGRRVLGEKGIGRFAASRLAAELEVITKQTSSSKEIYALFDWTQFDDDSKYLDEILILAEEKDRAEFCRGGTVESLWRADERPDASDLTHGTILRMHRLKRRWTADHVKDLQRGLARLVSPFDTHSDFSIRLDLPDEFADCAAEVAPPIVIKYPHYSAKGCVNAAGEYSFRYRVFARGEVTPKSGMFVHDGDNTELLKIEGDKASQSNRSRRLPECGPLEVELRIWDRDDLGNVVQQAGSTITDIRRDLDSMAGVNVYRDGFRVLPYGEPRNDWLRLDMRRVQNPTLRLSNNQIVGYVSISADCNPALRDQSNREGLDENPALQDLRQILLFVLGQIEELRFAFRPRKNLTAKVRPTSGLFQPLDLSPLREHLKKSRPEDEDIPRIIDQTERRIVEQMEEVQAVLARYHSLATLGQLIDVVLHDGRHPVGKILKDALLGQEEIAKASDQKRPPLPALRRRLESIEKQGDVMATVFRRIEPFGGRRRGRPTPLQLEQIVEDAIGIFETEIKRMHVKVSRPKTRTLVRVDAAEMQQVIANLLQNSLYWLQTTDEADRRIAISVERLGADHVQIIFADSGPGVAQEHRERIFEPYFSTRPIGVGLGLCIAGEIVSDYYNGKLELMDGGPLPGAVFRITLRERV